MIININFSLLYLYLQIKSGLMNQGFVGIISIEDAIIYEVTQISTSGCGITALLNVLVTLEIIKYDEILKLKINNCILRTRNNDAALPEYLLSRSIAGCTGEELLISMNTLIMQNNLNKIDSYFISYKNILKQGITLIDFITMKLQEGCSLIATLNLQLIGNDAWHHQCIYGIDLSTKDIYCMNPLCTYNENEIINYLSTDSMLFVRKEDILKRFHSFDGDISIYKHPKWQLYNVESQIHSMVATENNNITHLCIPANYIGGLSVFQKL